MKTLDEIYRYKSKRILPQHLDALHNAIIAVLTYLKAKEIQLEGNDLHKYVNYRFKLAKLHVKSFSYTRKEVLTEALQFGSFNTYIHEDKDPLEYQENIDSWNYKFNFLFTFLESPKAIKMKQAVLTFLQTGLTKDLTKTRALRNLRVRLLNFQKKYKLFLDSELLVYVSKRSL